MPKLIRLYIVNCAIGFAIALAFVSALVWLDVANLRHLVLETEKGYLGFLLMVLSNGVLFAGVQFGIAVMSLAGRDEGPKGGRRSSGQAPRVLKPIKVELVAHKRKLPHRR